MLLWFILGGMTVSYVLHRIRTDPWEESSPLAEGAQELGLAEDGTFVLVEAQPRVKVGDVGCAASPVGGVVPGCAPGRDCCADCKSGKVEVGYLAPGQSVVGTNEVHQMAAVLAQRIAGGDPDAIRRAERIFSMALEGGDLRARFVAEEVTRAMDHYTPGSGVAQYAVHGGWRKAIDDPNLRLDDPRT